MIVYSSGSGSWQPSNITSPGSGDEKDSVLAVMNPASPSTQTSISFRTDAAGNSDSSLEVFASANKTNQPCSFLNRISVPHFEKPGYNHSTEDDRNYLSQTVNFLLKLNGSWSSEGKWKWQRSGIKAFLGSWYAILEGVEKFLEIHENCCSSEPCVSCSLQHPLAPSPDLQAAEPTFLPSRTAEIIQPASPNSTISPGAAVLQCMNESGMRVVICTQLWVKHLRRATNMLQEKLRSVGVREDRKNKSCGKLSLRMAEAVDYALCFIADVLDGGMVVDGVHNFTKSGLSAPPAETAFPTHFISVSTDISYLLGQAYFFLQHQQPLSKTCRYNGLCNEINKTLAYLEKLSFVAASRTKAFRRSFSLVCGWFVLLNGRKKVGGLGLDVTKGRSDQLDTSMSTCANVETGCFEKVSLDCPKELFVRSDCTHSGSDTAFSPELFHFDLLQKINGVVFIDSNWSLSGRKPWCRLSCNPQPTGKRSTTDLLKEAMHKAFDIIFHTALFVSLYLIIASKENRRVMSGNPHRSYLYISFVTLCRFHIYSLSWYLPDKYWCHSDGSLVLDTADAGLLCRFEAVMLSTTAMMNAVVLTWAVLVWRKTLATNSLPLSREVVLCGLTWFEILEVGFVMVLVLIPVASVVSAANSSSLGFTIEGSAMYQVCIWVDFFNSPYNITTLVYGCLVLACGVAFLLFGVNLWHVMAQREKLRELQPGGRKSHHRNAQLTLRMWLRRHIYFSTSLSLHTFLAFGSAIMTATGNTNRTYKTAVEKYFKCRRSLSCETECQLDIPDTNASLFLLFAVVFLLSIHISTFAWIFFKEIEWKALSRFRRNFVF